MICPREVSHSSPYNKYSPTVWRKAEYQANTKMMSRRSIKNESFFMLLLLINDLCTTCSLKSFFPTHCSAHAGYIHDNALMLVHTPLCMCTHICCANGPVQFLSMHTPFPTHPHTLMHHMYMWQNINTLMVYTHTFKCKVRVCPSELAFAHAFYLIELFKQPLILFSFISVPY